MLCCTTENDSVNQIYFNFKKRKKMMVCLFADMERCSYYSNWGKINLQYDECIEL